jgi:hypothetical protein
MFMRCTNPNNPSYFQYGGRGITICERWKVFENFLADMGPRPEGYSIDRIDNDGHYEKGNCRWATTKVQNRNQRSNRILNMNGISKPLVVWAEDYKMSVPVLRNRIREGMTLEEALAKPVIDRPWRRKSADKSAAFEITP